MKCLTSPISAITFSLAVCNAVCNPIAAASITSADGLRRAISTPAACKSVERIGKTQLPPVLEATGADILLGKFDFSPVLVTGSVVDAFDDETNPDSAFVILNDSGSYLTIVTDSGGAPGFSCKQLISKNVSVRGYCLPDAVGTRTLLGRHICAAPDGISVIAQPDADLHSLPELTSIHATDPEDLTGVRHARVSGRVIAAWYGNHYLVKSVTGQPVTISHVEAGQPRIGEDIEVVGVPVTDLFQINLLRCRWRYDDVKVPRDPPSERVSFRDLVTDARGRTRYNWHYHGRKITFSGILRGHPSSEGSTMRILIDCQGYLVALYMDPEIARTLRSESTVEVTGVCVMNIGAWQTPAIIPRISEVLVSVASANDIRILTGPPWWTPGKFIALICGLLALVACLILINYLLKRKITQKSIELEREISARLRSSLKMRERTRLAVELHDSIAQSLSGIAMEIGSAMRFSARDSERMLSHLNIASKTLSSCRDDLKDCLWDLRSKALEIDDMNAAIRTTLKPYINDETLHIRFNVSRRQLSDNTAHGLLRIIRELVSNSIRHGHADILHIAGRIDGRKLLFSVRDNGCGFDPDNHPGVSQGHFGIQGIRERVNRFNGILTIDSAPGKGTKTTITIDVSSPDEEDEPLL